MFNALSRLCLKAIVFSLQVLLPLAQFVGFDVHLSPQPSRFNKSALTTKQKYLHTVDSPSFCILLTSPDDSLFLTSSLIPFASCNHVVTDIYLPSQLVGLDVQMLRLNYHIVSSHDQIETYILPSNHHYKSEYDKKYQRK